MHTATKIKKWLEEKRRFEFWWEDYAHMFDYIEKGLAWRAWQKAVYDTEDILKEKTMPSKEELKQAKVWSSEDTRHHLMATISIYEKAYKEAIEALREADARVAEYIAHSPVGTYHYEDLVQIHEQDKAVLNKCPEDRIDWENAEKYLYDVRERYEEIGPAGAPALRLTIEPLVTRYETGERTQALYDAIMALE
jgi:hypothetical protein